MDSEISTQTTGIRIVDVVSFIWTFIFNIMSALFDIFKSLIDQPSKASSFENSLFCNTFLESRVSPSSQDSTSIDIQTSEELPIRLSNEQDLHWNHQVSDSHSSEEQSLDDEDSDSTRGEDEDNSKIGEEKKKRKRRRRRSHKKSTVTNSTSIDEQLSQSTSIKSQVIKSQDFRNDKTFDQEKKTTRRLSISKKDQKPIQQQNVDSSSSTGKASRVSPPRFEHSALQYKSHFQHHDDQDQIRPIRQPLGPSLHHNGFTMEYQQSRSSSSIKHK